MSKIVNSLFEDILDEITFSEKVYYAIRRKFMDIRYSFRKARERLTHGFPLCEAWDFKSAHAKWCVPRLKHLRNNLNGHPTGLSSIEEWESILDKMIWSFEHHDDFVKPIYSDDYDHRLEVTEENGMKTYKPLNETGTIDWSPVHEHSNKVQEGLLLFSKYYVNLWD